MTTVSSSRRKIPRGSLEERRARRRQALIDSGVELFGRNGYRNCSVKMICDHANLTERYFYESFANREALLLGVYQCLAEELRSRLGQVVEYGDAPRGERVRRFIDTFFHYIRDDERRGRLLMFEILGVSPAVDLHYQAAVRDMADLVEHPNLGLFSKADVDPGNVRRVISIGLVGAMLQIAIQWVLDGFKTPLDKVSASTVEIFKAMSSHHS